MVLLKPIWGGKRKSGSSWNTVNERPEQTEWASQDCLPFCDFQAQGPWCVSDILGSVRASYRNAFRPLQADARVWVPGPDGLWPSWDWKPGLSDSGLPWWLSGKESACQCRRRGFHPWVGKIPCRKKWQPTPAFLTGKPHGQRSLAGYSRWGRKRTGHDLGAQQQQSISETTVGYAASTSRRLLEAVKKVRIYMFQVLKLGNGSKMN